MPLKHGNGVTGSTYGGKPLSGNQLMGALPSHRCTGFHQPGSLFASICQVLSRSSFVALLSLLYATCEKMQAKAAVCRLQPCTQGKRLAPSFGGVVRFIPEKYHQRITKFYTF
jgi:hypothetical protein